jgi:hypothetical protein
MARKIKLPEIAEEEKTETVCACLRVIEALQSDMQALRDEVARLKGHKEKPKIKPSKMEDGKDDKDDKDDKRPNGKSKSKNTKRAGSNKAKKKIEIHNSPKPLRPDNLPEGSKLKDIKTYLVQGMIIQPYNTEYRLERWVTPDGKYITAKLPEGIQGTHFDPILTSFILYQYYHCMVTQPLLIEQLRDLGIQISEGQLSNMLIESKGVYHDEKNAILEAGLKLSPYINVDDTGARHDGKNGYCTHIGNELFAWFESTNSKSRLNFLGLLRRDFSDYVLNVEALEYLEASVFPQKLFASIQHNIETRNPMFSNTEELEQYLLKLGITKPRHIKIATEAALLGSVIHHGLSDELVIVSDDAGQFNILNHSLCWVHAERLIHKLVTMSEAEEKILKEVRSQIWDLYANLKKYKKAANTDFKIELKEQFQDIVNTKTGFDTLDAALKRMGNNQDELLLVLDRPDIPLHNNLSESDIREYVKRRKISGSTRSVEGRKCRDTFAALKKTSRKLGVSFWGYIRDRVGKTFKIPPLSEIMQQRAAITFTPSY